MEMVYHLAAVFARIDDDAIAAIQLPRTGEIGSGRHHMPQQLSVFGHRLRLGDDVLLRNDEQVGRGLRVDIGKSDAEIVFKDTVRRNFALYDLAEQTVNWHRRVSAPFLFYKS